MYEKFYYYLMNIKGMHILCGIGIMLVLAASGCVAPPSASSTTPGSYGYTGETTPEPNVTTPGYVTEVTAFATTAQNTRLPGQGYSTFATSTPIPEDQTCLIYFNKQFYQANATAVAFDLKNPPMYINYSVIPFNVTVHKVFDARSGAPYSWFEITVRNKTSGEVYLKDGFGRAKGYGIYTNATLTILKRDNLLVELRGNNITASTGVWVKPYGNIEATENQTFPECKYWGHPQNSLDEITATPTPTWVP
jgi:hypothetical protein